MSDFLGAGWAFPPQTNGRGGIALVPGHDDISQAIYIILSTPVGQRVMRPTFGSKLHTLVFAPANPDTFGLAELYVMDALGFWEPRIDVLDVTARTDAEKPERLNIAIRYRVKSTHDERSLVYPFYQIPGE
ncbi:MAG: phage baseplate protein [Chloroflexi bacterium]|nr:MAG: phage baseplate protein [Chloroflexota bacterium]